MTDGFRNWCPSRGDLATSPPVPACDYEVTLPIPRLLGLTWQRTAHHRESMGVITAVGRLGSDEPVDRGT